MDANIPPVANSRASAYSAAVLVHDAALGLAAVAKARDEEVRYLDVASRLGAVLDSEPTRVQILDASPRVQERSGQVRTLVEMIEDDPGDSTARLRLVTLLLRALIWRQAGPPPTRREGLVRRETIRYQRELIDKKLDEIRRSRGPRPGS